LGVETMFKNLLFVSAKGEGANTAYT